MLSKISLIVFEEAEKPQIDEVLHTIVDVNDWRSLGKHLGIESSKLDEIGRHPVKEQKSRMVNAWFESDEECTWEKLREALKKPSVSETRAAEKVDRIRRASLLKDRSAYKDSIEAISPTSTTSMKTMSLSLLS